MKKNKNKTILLIVSNTHKIKMKTKAPNEYSIPSVLGSSKEAHIRSAPSYTLVGRQKIRQSESQHFPGPGAYDGNYENILRKPPQYSMGQRIMKTLKSDIPGPGQHFPEKVFAF